MHNAFWIESYWNLNLFFFNCCTLPPQVIKEAIKESIVFRKENPSRCSVSLSLSEIQNKKFLKRDTRGLVHKWAETRRECLRLNRSPWKWFCVLIYSDRRQVRSVLAFLTVWQLVKKCQVLIQLCTFNLFSCVKHFFRDPGFYSSFYFIVIWLTVRF